MDPEERRKRHELSYGMYNFRDVKAHFSKQGWTFRPGPSLSYDHYYVKPGKNPRNKQHTRGVDYFLGEAELVAYARKLGIFGPETAPLLGPHHPADGSRRRARSSSSSSARASQTTVEMDSETSDSDGGRRPKHKRHRRRSPKVGDSATNPIALSSDSSEEENAVGCDGVDVDSVEEDEDEEEWTEGDTKGGFDEEEEEEETEELSDEDSSSSSALSSEEDTNNDEPEDDDATMVMNAKQSVKPPRGNGKVEDREKAAVKAEAKPETQGDDYSASSSENEEKSAPSHKSPRPLLTTSHKKKHSTGMLTSKRRNHLEKKCAASSKRKRRAFQTRIGKKAKLAPRNSLQDAINDRDERWEDNDENDFSLGVEECGESPPRRPPSRVHPRANSVRSSPATSVVGASPPPEFEEEEKEEASPASPTPAPPSSASTASANSHSFISPSTRATPTFTPSSHSKTAHVSATPITAPVSRPKNGLVSSTNAASVPPVSDVNVANTSAQVSMELTQVVLPPDCDNKYHIRVSMLTEKPPVHTIWMKNLSSHEQREASFADVTELPGAKPDLRVPTATVLTALFRCLSSQPGAVVILGPEPRTTAESKAASEKGEVQLQTSTAEKNNGNADDGGNEFMLIVSYPALDLFRVDHHFPMKLVSSDQQLQHLAKEVERLKEQLIVVQTDRDKLCEQLRQQEEDNEQTLAQQVEAKVKATIGALGVVPSSNDELEQQVAKAVEEKTRILEQAREKEKLDRDRARRCIFARSDWMVAFQPCRTLIAGASTEAKTSLLRPATAARARTYVVEWKEVVEIAEPFFQPTTSGSVRSITVVKDGVYQVNANVSHDSLMQLRLVINPAADATASPREIAPTKVLLYDNKRRVSRVDRMLELHALDQLSLELRLLDSTIAPSRHEEWLRAPMPPHNRFLVVVLEEHALWAVEGDNLKPN